VKQKFNNKGLTAIERLELATELLDQILEEADKELDQTKECHLKLVVSDE